MTFALRRFSILLLRCLAVPFLLVLLCGPGSSLDSQSASGTPNQETQPGTPLRARTNLVVVRVIVRDSHGKPITGLKPGDFKVFDNRKQQTIVVFDTDSPAPVPADAASLPAPKSSAQPAAAPTAPAAPISPHYTALFFDDFHMAFGDLVQVREAATRYIRKNLDAGARVAIWTASGKPLLPFSTDRAKLQDAVSQIRFDARFEPHECPKLPAQFAEAVAEDVPMDTIASSSQSSGGQTNPESLAAGLAMDKPLKIAEAIAAQEDCPATPHSPDEDMSNRARLMVLQNNLGVQATFDSLGRLVQLMADTPGGERTIALVSDGFFDRTLQYRMDALIDRALRANVVVNALDARGLYAEPPGG